MKNKNTMDNKKIGMVGPTDKPPKTVSTQPDGKTVGLKAFGVADYPDEAGEVPHFASNVGHSQTQGDRQR
jgi:hypothetical protein